MFQPIKVMTLELSHPFVDLEGLGAYKAVQALGCWHGKPLGYVTVEVTQGYCLARALEKAVQDQGWAYPVEPVVSPREGQWPLVTVAVCSRNRTHELALCLEALRQIDYPHLELMVVDNAPKDDATQRLVQRHYPEVRYICEAHPGLDWARNRAIEAARGEFIAFTDDDVIADSGWVKALATVFIENPKVAAVTGLVLPYELETEAQALFEQYGGFGRGFERKYYSGKPQNKWEYHGAGKFGTGANMAYRRQLFDLIGYFDPALDVGTVTNGGGDLEMFFRILKEGYCLVYEPSAIVFHRHRREYTQLRTQLANNGIGLYSYMVRSAMIYPDERMAFIGLGAWWLWWWNIRRWLISLIHPDRFPRDLIEAELWGSLRGLFRYQKARSIAAQIANRSREPFII
jgi:O-antigen biosynthesis protein